MTPRVRAMLDFAVVVSVASRTIEQCTVDELKAAGLSDEDVLNVVEVAGFFNYYNRMVDALGVEPEDFMASNSGDG